jgi:hypothetical protein
VFFGKLRPIEKILAQYGKDAPARIGEYVKSMKDALK